MISLDAYGTGTIVLCNKGDNIGIANGQRKQECVVKHLCIFTVTFSTQFTILRSGKLRIYFYSKLLVYCYRAVERLCRVFASFLFW